MWKRCRWPPPMRCPCPVPAGTLPTSLLQKRSLVPRWSRPLFTTPEIRDGAGSAGSLPHLPTLGEKQKFRCFSKDLTQPDVSLELKSRPQVTAAHSPSSSSSTDSSKQPGGRATIPMGHTTKQCQEFIQTPPPIWADFEPPPLETGRCNFSFAFATC